jgi:hypothetical protein
LITFITTALAAIILWFQPKQYLSTATALPASSVAADKARIFNENIEYLYSNFGNTDDLDRILGTAELDTLFKAVAAENTLGDYYKIKDGDKLFGAAKHLKENSDIVKSGFGELKIKVWDKDKEKAAQLANSLLKNLQSIHQQLQSSGNALILQNIKADHQALSMQLQNSDDSTLNNDANIASARKAAQLQQLQQYEKLIAEYNLMLRTNPPVLLVVENATPSYKADKPKSLQTILLVLFASAAFAFLMVLFFESRKTA